MRPESPPHWWPRTKRGRHGRARRAPRAASARRARTTRNWCATIHRGRRSNRSAFGSGPPAFWRGVWPPRRRRPAGSRGAPDSPASAPANVVCRVWKSSSRQETGPHRRGRSRTCNPDRKGRTGHRRRADLRVVREPRNRRCRWTDPPWVIVLRASPGWSSLWRTRATPMSRILTAAGAPSGVRPSGGTIMIFDGLMSRWTRPCSWA